MTRDRAARIGIASTLALAAVLAGAAEERSSGPLVAGTPRAAGAPSGGTGGAESAQAPPARTTGADADSARARARVLGLRLGVMAPGPRNDITDVEGVRVGHYTLRSEPRFNTGITAILPHGGSLYLEKVPAAIVVGNGFGKLAGSTQVNELGEIETPILLTGTLSVHRVADGLIGYMLSLPGMEEVRSINPIVGETNDGFLSDIRARPLGEAEVRAAIEAAGPGPVPMGAVGAGAGTVCFGFKGGIGSSSRRLEGKDGGWTVGVLVQSNFGGPLRIGGLPLQVEGTPLGDFLMRSVSAKESPSRGLAGDGGPGGRSLELRGPSAARGAPSGESDHREREPQRRADPIEASVAVDGGSLMIVIATDAPLDHRNLRRLAARSLYGMALTGGYGANGSGDYAIAFSTHEKVRIRRGDSSGVVERLLLGNESAGRLFQAVTEATEEAIVDSLFTARSVRGHLGSVPALPVEEVLELAGQSSFGACRGPHRPSRSRTAPTMRSQRAPRKGNALDASIPARR